MAKVKKATSVHSRAARRAVSPSLNLDKSVRNAPRPSSPTRTSLTTPAAEKITRKVLDVIHRTLASGVQKSSNPNKIQKRGQKSKVQKKRREIGKEKAAAFAEVLERKEEDGRKKVKVIKDRRGEWEAVNSKIVDGEGEMEETVSTNPFAALTGNAVAT
ncbi:hypothetical protein H072_6974 [Dactylellina haptotyla CBS 200.50]|uniref:Ribosome biogenesis protein Alb1 n=1 Tax=Dactylellina haptotyla (strain CBS 200.50) TaxID=1284197 RepID=S8A8L8_DACHA|nr:hypothetical protein H072_6974 [Dactylellina haptotyla CBS 200.50]